MPMKTRRDKTSRPDTPNRASVRKIITAAVAELEARGEHVNGESVARVTGLRQTTASRYIAGLRKKGDLPPATNRKPPEKCNYTTVQTPEKTIRDRLDILAARTKELGRRLTLDEICATFPE
jgi:hypothetical protein